MDKYTELPPEIRKQVKKVDQMIADRAKAKETPVETPVETPPIETTPETPPVEEKVEAPPVEPTEPVTPTEPKTYSQQEYDRLQQELNTLRGKYDKEPAELMRQVNFLQDQIRQLQEGQQVRPEPKVIEKPKAVREILESDPRIKALKDSLAPEVFEGVMAVQERVYDLANERAKEVISQEVSKVDANFAKTRSERFWDDLRKTYPNWADLRVSPEFQTFTNEVDPLTGVQKYWIIKDAFDQMDAGRVIRFLDIATGKGNSPPIVETKDKIVSEKVAAKVAPPKSSGPTPSVTPSNKMTVDQAKDELVKIANLKNRGQWKGTDDEYKKKDITLRKIIREGSVSP